MYTYFNRIDILTLTVFSMVAIILLAGTQPAFAQIDSRLKADGWKEFTFDDKKQNIF